MSREALLLSLAAVVCWGIGAIFDKLAVHHLQPNVAFISRFYVSFLLMLPFMALTWQANRAGVQQAGWSVVVYLVAGTFFTILGMYVYYKALWFADVSRVAPFTAIYPLVTFVLAMFFLREPFTAGKVAGTVLVVGGAYLLSK